MATSSIFNNILITNNAQAELLVTAMEAAKEVAEKTAREGGHSPVSYRELKGEEVKEFFKGIKGI